MAKRSKKSKSVTATMEMIEEDHRTAVEKASDAWVASKTPVTTIAKFLKTGKSNTWFEGLPVIREEDSGSSKFTGSLRIVKSKVLYCLGAIYISPPDGKKAFSEDERGDDWRNGSPDAVLLPSSKKGYAFSLLRDGDDNEFEHDHSISVKDEFDCPTISFGCVAALMGNDPEDGNDRDQALSSIASGKIKIVDYVSDETRAMTEAQRKQAIKHAKKGADVVLKNLTPPEHGFTAISSPKWHWHRAATILLKAGKETWMVGQDEGTYFGVVLGDHPSTIKDAYLSLVPEQLQNTRNCIRQGEWFAYPVPKNQVPDEVDCFCVFGVNAETVESRGGGLGVVMPKGDPESNSHLLIADEGRISKDGIFARKFEMQHEEHSTLVPENKTQWYCFARNTAKRSVSMQGVD